MWKWLTGEPAPIVMPEVAARTPADKVNFHIRRFTLALEQCEKGSARKTDLRRNLDYWKAIKAARDTLEGVG